MQDAAERGAESVKMTAMRIREAARIKTDLSVDMGRAKDHRKKPIQNLQEVRKLDTAEIQQKLTQMT